MNRFPVLPVGAAVLGCAIIAVGLVAFGPFKRSAEDNWDTTESRVPIDPKLVSAHTDFALSLFREMLDREPDKNVLLCPASVNLVLSMTYNGAVGDTQRGIAHTLRIDGISPKELNSKSSALLSNLTGLGPGVRLTFANALWGNKTVAFKPDFVRRCKDSYAADMTSLDFESPTAVREINDWVDRNTRGKISKIVDRISPGDILILTNAAYFRGAWKDPFDRSRTKDAPFHLADGSTRDVPMMNKSEAKVGMYAAEDFSAISIPYGKGRVRMYVFLPKQDSNLAAFYKLLTPKMWRTWLPEFREQEVMLAMPRFKTDYEIRLNQILSDLGMQSALSPAADFTGICDLKPAWISEVAHKVYIDVNEEGTEAAAATGGMLSAAIPVRFTVDRPFFFAIRDERTGEILFMGSIVDPTAS